MDQFMKQAIQLALDNVEKGGQPFGAVLVRGNEVIAEGVNELHLHYDISGHAELLAIRRAQADLKTLDLSDCTIYASGEPCAMCLTAMYFAGIQDVYYAASVDDAEQAGLGKSKMIYRELAKARSEREINIIQMQIDQSLADPMKQWKDKQK
ncbi:nucleoside deaminase [Bacillus sp. S/N-304-OC-R1]|uniref:nucleoside deaminase n=1 Tax=Bacillus sp. S/N-304-OC-R1 TaxID=2758034 RepID=UPI001C8E3AC5|nr:nucleoside deaminase [Bacillus sp. S/N-304-OC-R1]MBY0121700.1 nucleoside deaminase [Bacillus sp. S/N-304-OC-R1]